MARILGQFSPGAVPGAAGAGMAVMLLTSSLQCKRERGIFLLAVEQSCLVAPCKAQTAPGGTYPGDKNILQPDSPAAHGSTGLVWPMGAWPLGQQAFTPGRCKASPALCLHREL